MRLSGLASGFDTDDMVKQLMQVERIKVDRVEQQKQTVQWRQEEYNSVNKKLANFILNTQKDMGLKKSSSTGALFGSSYKNADYVRSAVSSNEAIANINNVGNAQNGRFDLHVKEMPKNATLTSADMSDFKFEDKDGKALTSTQFKINGTMITVENDGKEINMDDVVKAINNATKDVENKEGKKTKESLGVEAFYDKGTGRLFMQATKGDTNKKTGEFKLDVTPPLNGNGNGFVGAFKSTDNGYGIENSQAGNVGEVTINGIEVDALDGRVNFNGLSIELKAAGETSINVRTDVDGIMGKVEKFVEDYNKLVDELSNLTNEKVYRDYQPLSPEERKALSEEDVKMWDEKAKSGLLNRDETISRTLQSMRNDIYKTLETDGSFNHITQIGISTEKYAQGSAGGKLQIDEKKLREAIEKDADGVMDLLFKEGNFENGKEVLSDEKTLSGNSSQGVINRIYDKLMDGMKEIIDKSGPGNDENLYRSIRSNMLVDFRTKKGSISDLDKSIMNMDKEIANLNILLDKKEESHYAKFTAMEKAMYKMNNQSDWLYQQMQF